MSPLPPLPRPRPLLRKAAIATIASAAIAVLALATALVFGGPRDLPPLAAIHDAFADADFSALPAPRQLPARDGTLLGYRRYGAPPPAPGATPGAPGSVVLVHGSSGHGVSLHPLALALQNAGFEVAALDIRGHGRSGPHGHIGYVGQLEDDLSDAMQALALPRPVTLLGFSAGGGFALRIAGGARRVQFDGVFDHYLLLAPYLHHSAPTNRPGGNDWAAAGIPRLLALVLLDRLGVTAWHDLPVLSFAITPDPQAGLTRRYSYALQSNFGTGNRADDHRQALRSIRRPATLLIGEDDELFDPTRFAALLAELGRADIPVTRLPGVGHMALTLAPGSHQAIVRALQSLRQPRG